ncbi:hypothetical protein HKX48_004196 [Thoreauomyces humboldtii]|nr:hypothetical protein HKX48_004196 [Thoreauomyces humboldtii]
MPEDSDIEAAQGSSQRDSQQEDWSDRLKELASLRRSQSSLSETHRTLLSQTLSIDHLSTVLSSLTSEQRLLLAERASLIASLEEVNKDLSDIAIKTTLVRAETLRRKEEADNLRKGVYEPRKTKLDERRRRLGLTSLPGVESTIERENAKYLQERRERWRDTGVLDAEDVGGAGPSTDASASGPAPTRESRIRLLVSPASSSPTTSIARGEAPSNKRAKTKRR